MEPVTMQSIWITAALIASVPLGFVVAPLVVETLLRLRRRHGVGPPSQGARGG